MIITLRENISGHTRGLHWVLLTTSSVRTNKLLCSNDNQNLTRARLYWCKGESNVASRLVHRESNLMFTLSSDKNQRKNLLLLSVNEPLQEASVHSLRMECNCVWMKTGLSIVSIVAVHWSFHCTNPKVLPNGLQTLLRRMSCIKYTSHFPFEHSDPAKGPFTLTSSRQR